MFCCGMNSCNDIKLYIKNYLRMFDIQESKPSPKLEISNEWENIATPQGQ